MNELKLNSGKEVVIVRPHDGIGCPVTQSPSGHFTKSWFILTFGVKVINSLENAKD